MIRVQGQKIPVRSFGNLLVQTSGEDNIVGVYDKIIYELEYFKLALLLELHVYEFT